MYEFSEIISLIHVLSFATIGSPSELILFFYIGFYKLVTWKV